MQSRLALGLALALVLGALGGCGGQDGNSASSRGKTQASTTLAPNPQPPVAIQANESIVAEAAVASVGVYDSPIEPEPSRRLGNPTPTGTKLVFLVKERHAEWLHVLLPVRPNGSMGWVRQSDVKLSAHNYRIVVELTAHMITVTKGDEVFMKEPVGIGRRETPTPGGLYYTKELLQPTDTRGRPFSTGPYGPYAYALSGFSEVLYNFAGGEGVIGIHGTNDPGGLGKDVSHGCIRMRNEAITKLAETLPVGVPVEIRP